MNKEGKFTVIRERVDPTTAMQSVAGMMDDVAVVVEGSVFYPYVAFTAQCVVPTMIGKKEITVDCLVDGVNGHGATADSFSTQQMVARNEVRLQSRITDEEARRTAQRIVTHRLGKKLKLIAPFDVQLESAGTVYKRFWIIRIGDGRIMADSVTGNMHPLSASAA